jgi:hypothetical protein
MADKGEFGNGKSSGFGDIESRYVIDNRVFTKYVSGVDAIRPVKYYTRDALATIPVKTYGSRLKDNDLLSRLTCWCTKHPDEYRAATGIGCGHGSDGDETEYTEDE